MELAKGETVILVSSNIMAHAPLDVCVFGACESFHRLRKQFSQELLFHLHWFYCIHVMDACFTFLTHGDSWLSCKDLPAMGAYNITIINILNCYHWQKFIDVLRHPTPYLDSAFQFRIKNFTVVSHQSQS